MSNKFKEEIPLDQRKNLESRANSSGEEVFCGQNDHRKNDS